LCFSRFNAVKHKTDKKSAMPQSPAKNPNEKTLSKTIPATVPAKTLKTGKSFKFSAKVRCVIALQNFHNRLERELQSRLNKV
jgi:hypothetical protein